MEWHPTFVQCWELKLPKLNRHGMNILVVEGTVHITLKEVRAIATVIALACFDVGHLKKEKKKKKDEKM